MKITDFSIKQPMTVLVVVVVVLVLGAVSFSRLAIDLYPEMNLPVGAVMTSYPGAGPEEVENLVTRPMESVLGSVTNLDQIFSISSSGSSMVIVLFNWGTDMDFASLEMRENVDIIRGVLPDGAGNPMVFKMDPTMMPVMQIMVTGDRSHRVKQVAEDLIQPRLERIDGVAAVRVEGGVQREIKVLVDQTKLNGYGLGLEQVTQALRSENMTMSGGDVISGRKDIMVRAYGEFDSIADIENVMINTGQGGVVSLKDVAEVVDGSADASQLSRVNGQPGLSLLIQKQSSTNTVEVSREIQKVLAELKLELPSDIQFTIVMDQAEFIENTIQSVKNKIVVGGSLAILILLLFLRNVRSTLIISTAIPISIIGTFALLYFNKMTLNIVTMGGLALGVGLIVDDAIVVLENIYRHRQEGYGLVESARMATDEVGNAVIASTLTILAVFMPIVFVEGLASQIFKPMALTVGFAVTVSMLVALTLVPLLSSRYLSLERADTSTIRGKLYKFSGDKLDSLYEWYRGILKWSLGRKKTVITIITVMLVASLALIPLVGAEFMPTMDEGYVQVNLDLPSGTTLAETDRITTQVERLGLEIPEVENIITNVGFTGSQGMGSSSSDLAQVFLQLVPERQRDRSTEEVAQVLREKTRGIAGADITITATGPASAGHDMGAPVSIILKGDQLDVLRSLGDEAVKLVEKVPGTTEVSHSMDEGRPEIRVVADRNRAASYGLGWYQIASAVQTAIQGNVATYYRTGGDEIDVRVSLKNGADLTVQDLENLTVTSPVFGQVPLRQVAHLIEIEGPTSIMRMDQSRVVTIDTNISGRDLSSIMQDISEKLENELTLPAGYTIEYRGQAEEMMDAFGNLALALLLAIVMVYLVMVAKFGSLLYPFIIMFSVPVTLIGIIISLLISGWAFGVTAFIGIILLVGIVVKNAIILVDYVNVLRSRGMERDEALIKGGATRLRPILMTASSGILAMLPLAIGIGEGAEMQAPMAVVVVGGLTFSTIITLVLVPVMYAILDDIPRKLKERRERKKQKKLEGNPADSSV